VGAFFLLQAFEYLTTHLGATMTSSILLIRPHTSPLWWITNTRCHPTIHHGTRVLSHGTRVLSHGTRVLSHWTSTRTWCPFPTWRQSLCSEWALPCPLWPPSPPLQRVRSVSRPRRRCISPPRRAIRLFHRFLFLRQCLLSHLPHHPWGQHYRVGYRMGCKYGWIRWLWSRTWIIRWPWVPLLKSEYFSLTEHTFFH
jgi:hypothetical protein